MELYFYLAAIMFGLGLTGSVLKKDLISKLLCIELMLTAVNIFFVLFSKQMNDPTGSVQVIFTVILAAAEAAIGISLIISLYRKTKSPYSEDVYIY